MDIMLRFGPCAVRTCLLEKYFTTWGKKLSLKYHCLEVWQWGITLLCELPYSFCINLYMTEDIYLSKSFEMVWFHSHWYNFLLLCAFCGSGSRSCVLFNIKLLSLNFRGSPKWNRQVNLFPGVINVIKSFSFR